MRTISLLFIIFFICPNIKAQNFYRIRVLSQQAFCGFRVDRGYYNLDNAQEYITRRSEVGDSTGLADVVGTIQKTLNFSVPISVYVSENENNCFATIEQNGSRLIVADHHFLNNVNVSSGTRWAAISILAHEVGHHIAGFSRYSDKKESELAADYWSGYILQKLGAGRNAAVRCILFFGSETDTFSHPNKYSRAQSIEKGWDDAFNNTMDRTKCEGCN